ncbi:hypothetical protein D3C81_2244990 [compost metagenome]
MVERNAFVDADRVVGFGPGLEQIGLAIEQIIHYFLSNIQVLRFSVQSKSGGGSGGDIRRRSGIISWQ